MKTSITFLIPILLMSAVLLSGCTTHHSDVITTPTSTTKAHPQARDTMVFTVTLVRPAPDGLVLFMQDDQGREYTTITQHARAKIIQLAPGDTVSIVVQEIIATPKASMVIGRDIQKVR